MADLTSIRQALASQITNKTGLRAEAAPRDQVSPPVALVMPGNPLISYADDMSGSVTIALAVLIVVSDAPPVSMSQQWLDGWLGVVTGVTASIPAAIAADPTLGGVVQWCQPVSAGSYGRVEIGGVGMFGARLNLTVGAI